LTAVILVGLIDLKGIRLWPPKLRIVFLPTFFLVSIPIAVVYPDSNVDIRDELKRISGQYLNTSGSSANPSRSSDGWSVEGLGAKDDFINKVSELSTTFSKKGSSVGYFGPFGHTIELLTEVENLVGLASTESLRFGTTQEQLACVPVSRSNADVIIVYNSDFPCDGYVIVPQEPNTRFAVWMRDG